MGSEESDHEKSSEHFEKNSLELVRRSEENPVEVARKWADNTVNVVPLEMRLLRQVLTDAFDLREKVHELEREFVERLVGVARVPGTKVTAKPATKPTSADRIQATTKPVRRAG